MKNPLLNKKNPATQRVTVKRVGADREQREYLRSASWALFHSLTSPAAAQIVELYLMLSD